MSVDPVSGSSMMDDALRQRYQETVRTASSLQTVIVVVVTIAIVSVIVSIVATTTFLNALIGNGAISMIDCVLIVNQISHGHLQDVGGASVGRR